MSDRSCRYCLHRAPANELRLHEEKCARRPHTCVRENCDWTGDDIKGHLTQYHKVDYNGMCEYGQLLRWSIEIKPISETEMAEVDENGEITEGRRWSVLMGFRDRKSGALDRQMQGLSLEPPAPEELVLLSAEHVFTDEATDIRFRLQHLSRKPAEMVYAVGHPEQKKYAGMWRIRSMYEPGLSVRMPPHLIDNAPNIEGTLSKAFAFYIVVQKLRVAPR